MDEFPACIDLMTNDTARSAPATRIAVGRRIAYYKAAASPDYWDGVWQQQKTEQLYKDAMQGNLGYYESIFTRHLPKDGRIIEAGCGLAQFVIALRARGYDVEGVDYASKVIDRVKSKFPELPVRAGDVTRLDVNDGYYQAYISLGVMEHRQQGPDIFLNEANRILTKGGIALISVPYINAIRWLKMKTGTFSGRPNGLEFYQYAYTPSEFDELLRAAGFEVTHHYQYGGYKGVKDELPFLTRVYDFPQGWRLRKFLMNWRWSEAHMGHMMMYVCRK